MTCQGGYCDRQFHDLSASIGSAANFPTQSSLIHTGHHLCAPLCLLSFCSSISGVTLFPFISWLPLPLHYGTSKCFDSPSLAPSHPSPLQFLALCLHSIYLSLAVHLNCLCLTSPSLSLSSCLPLLSPSVQTSVSKRLGVVFCAKPSAQIWITAVWRYV